MIQVTTNCGVYVLSLNPAFKEKAEPLLIVTKVDISSDSIIPVGWTTKVISLSLKGGQLFVMNGQAYGTVNKVELISTMPTIQMQDA